MSASEAAAARQDRAARLEPEREREPEPAPSGGGSARWVMLALASLQLLLSSGLVLGWMGFILILKGEGAFAGICDADGGGGSGSGGSCAAEQDLKLSEIFTVGSEHSNGCSSYLSTRAR